LKEDGSGSAYDKESMAIIKLNNTTVLYLKEVTKFLALVCILREESFERKGLIDYNFHCFRKAIHEVFEVIFVHWAATDLNSASDSEKLGLVLALGGQLRSASVAPAAPSAAQDVQSIRAGKRAQKNIQEGLGDANTAGGGAAEGRGHGAVPHYYRRGPAAASSGPRSRTLRGLMAALMARRRGSRAQPAPGRTGMRAHGPALLPQREGRGMGASPPARMPLRPAPDSAFLLTFELKSISFKIKK
ncbi:hypothetical protein H8959_005711, partial [Pygathrix nigripes]